MLLIAVAVLSQTGKALSLFASDEAAEGMMAFAQKRKPRWTD